MFFKLHLANLRGEHRTIKLAYVLSFISEFYFPITVWIFYYLRYLDFTQVALITAIQAVTTIVFEVPTGAFADVFGRKTSLFLSFLLYGLAMFGTTLATVFWVFALLDVIKGIANALYSGSLEALVYDTLKEQGREHHFDQVNANINSISWIGLLFSALIGGYLYSLQFQSPYFIQGLMYLGGTAACIFLIEPHIDTQKYNFISFMKQNLLGFQELFQNRKVAEISLILIALSMGYYITANFLGISQAKQYGLDSVGVGFLFAAGYLLSIAASQLFPTLKRRLGTSRLLIITGVVLIGSLLLANFVGIFLGGAFIIARIASSSVFNNVRASAVNALVGSKNRATAISSMALLYKIPYALLALFMGSYIDRQSPNSFALVLSIGLLIILGICLVVKYTADKRS